MNLHTLPDICFKKTKRVGRGPGSGMGKTSTRGQNGAGSRSGYKRRLTYEGGQFRLFMKLPTRGFTRGRFLKRLDFINLCQIEKTFKDGEEVNIATLREHGFITGKSHGLKVLGKGELTKKVTIKADAFSESAKTKLEKEKITFSITS